MAELSTLHKKQPRSSLMCYANNCGDSTFSTGKAEIVSPFVAEKLYSKFIRDLWDLMISDPFIGAPKVFETYCRTLMVGTAKDFQRRPGEQKSSGQAKSSGRTRSRGKTKEPPKASKVTLGGCSDIRIVLDIVVAAKEHPMVLFHSFDPNHPHYDFMYRSHDGTFHAFQVTISKTHKADEGSFKDMRTKLGDSPLVFYYMMPEERFAEFVTKHVCPVVDEFTHIWYLKVPTPI